MDLSKLCSSKEDDNLVPISSSVEGSSNNIYLPSITELQQSQPQNTNNVNNYQNNEFRQRYHFQHRHLKDIHYVDSSRTQPSPQSEYYPQQQQQNYLPPCPPNVSHTAPPTIPSLPPPLSTNTSDASTTTVTDQGNNSFLIQQLSDQCNSIYSRIGKYRVDPLTESERSQIIDQVYFTTEKMLQSLKHLQSSENNTNSSNTVMSTDSMSEIETNTNTIDTENYNTNSQVEDMDEYKIIRQARNLQDNNTRPKYRRRSKRSMIGQRCHSCNTTETPEWRRGPDGARTLCNACGLHYSKLIRKGSMTVQTHNYLLEAGNTTTNSTPEFKRAPRIIQFPIIQVNNNTSSSTTTTSSFNNSNLVSSNNSSRITEIHDDEDDEMFENKIKDVG